MDISKITIGSLFRILSAVNGKTLNQTQLSLKARTARRYFPKLVELGFLMNVILRESNHGTQAINYTITEKGIDLLNQIKDIFSE